MKFGSSYLQIVYNDPEEYGQLVTRVAAKVLELQKKARFHAIAFRGTSGAAMAYPVSAATGIPLICIRKEGENSHHGDHRAEGSNRIDVKKYLIIDDFISTGRTMDAIVDAIDRARERNSVKCVGILLYGEWNGTDTKYKKIPIVRIK